VTTSARALVAALLLLVALPVCAQEETDPWQAYEKQVEQELCLTLAESFPQLPAQLEKEWYAEEEQPALRAALLDLLEKAQALTGGQRGAALLAADRLAGKLWTHEREAPDWKQLQQDLGRYGLTFAWSELAGAYEYQHDLLWWLWRTAPASVWGRHAFALLLAKGWDTSGTCQEGTDQFRRVIEQGEAFLAGHPHGWPALQTTLALAQAYETWWSLSRAPANDDYAYAPNYQEGADAAREKAVAYYQQVVRLAPNSPAAAYARLRLPPLQAEQDTPQRRYFCIYD
jgi:hypothetical protein